MGKTHQATLARCDPSGFSRRLPPPAAVDHLTLPGDGSPSTENFARLSDGGRKVLRWLTDHFGLTWKADLCNHWVREQGPSGTQRLHQHMVVKCAYVPRRKLRAFCKKVGLGFSDVRALNSGAEVARYLSKDLSKDLTRSWPRYSRRVQASAPRPPADPGWKFEKRPRQPKRTWWSDAVSPILREAMSALNCRVSGLALFSAEEKLYGESQYPPSGSGAEQRSFAFSRPSPCPHPLKCRQARPLVQSTPRVRS